MINLTGDLKQNRIVDQQQAELYMRIYKYAAEDFANHSDLEVFINNLRVWMESVETRLTTLSKSLQTHTHPITPHIHSIPTHTHAIPPHTHIGNLGSPVSPTPLITMPGTSGATVVNEILQSGTPANPSALEWRQITIPATYVNTTGTITNYAANKATVGTSVVGSATPHLRRVAVIPDAAIPVIPPYLVPEIV